jgi:hypothetical protein
MNALHSISGKHLLAVFGVFLVAGFIVVYADQYVFSKLESAIGVTPTVF